MMTDIQELTHWAAGTLTRLLNIENAEISDWPDNRTDRLPFLRRRAIEQNLSTEETARCCAIYIAWAVLRETLSPEEGLKYIVAVCGIDYDWRYQPFDLLDDDIDRLLQGETPLFNTGLTLADRDRYVTEAFILFLQMERNPIGREAETLSYCETCGNVSEPVHTQNGWLCSRCGSERLLHFTDLKGRKIIYDHLATQRNDSL